MSDCRQTLGDLLKDGRERIFVSCETCARTSSRSASALIGEYGSDIGLSDLLCKLSQKCPQRTPQAVEPCGVRFGELCAPKSSLARRSAKCLVGEFCAWTLHDCGPSE